MILCLGTTPAAQRVMVFPRLMLDSVNRATTTLDGVAGKAVNVAKVLKALGEEPVVAGFVGGERGALVHAALAARKIETELLTVPSATRQCTTVLDQADGTVTELVEESQPVPAECYRQLLAGARARLSNCRALILSGTITPGGPVDFYAQCVRMAKAAGCLSLVDARGPLLMEALTAAPDLVKPNRTELASTLDQRLDDDSAIVRAMQELHSHGARMVVVTAGKLPALAFDGRECWRVHPPQIQPLNPIGSGDACTAAIAWRLLRGDDLGEACRWGAAAGAANALNLMAGEVDPQEVQRLAVMVKKERL
jgi:1-phosphofructokinase family hexose kinase